MDPGSAFGQVRILIVLVTAARKAGQDPLATMRAVMPTPPPPEVVAAVEDIIDSPEVGYQPGQPGLEIIARIEALWRARPL